MDKFVIKRDYKVTDPLDDEQPPSPPLQKPKKRRVAIPDFAAESRKAENESMFRQPKLFLPHIERIYKEHDKRLANNPHHMCASAGGKCGCRPLNVIIYRKNIDFLDRDTPDILRYHICIPELCKHTNSSHLCGGDEKLLPILKLFVEEGVVGSEGVVGEEKRTERQLAVFDKYVACPHSVAYSTKDTYVFENLFVCPVSGNIHACGLNCSVKFTDVKSGGQHVCPISAMVLGSILHDWRMDSNIFTTKDTDAGEKGNDAYDKPVDDDDDHANFDSRDVDTGPEGKKASFLKNRIMLCDYDARREITRTVYVRLLVFLYTSVERQSMELASTMAMLKKINEKIIDIISKNNANLHNEILWTLFTGCQTTRYFNCFQMSSEVRDILRRQAVELPLFFSSFDDGDGELPKAALPSQKRATNHSQKPTLMFRAHVIKRAGRAETANPLLAHPPNIGQQNGKKQQTRILELLDIGDDGGANDFLAGEIEKMCGAAWKVFDHLNAFFTTTPDRKTGLTMGPMDGFLLPLLYLMIDGYSVSVGSKTSPIVKPFDIDQAIYTNDLQVVVIPKIPLAVWLPSVDVLPTFFQNDPAAGTRYKVKNVVKNQKTIKHMFEVIAEREDDISKFCF